MMSKRKPVIKKDPPLDRDYNQDPNSQALKRKVFINHRSTLNPQPDSLR